MRANTFAFYMAWQRDIDRAAEQVIDRELIEATEFVHERMREFV